jgi:4-amino-4-deoxy-L-arabinose transferase-like glycosyltransferase
MKYFKVIKIILITIIIALGAFLRFYDLERQSYWMDEGYTINAVISGQENGFTLSGASILDSGKTYACQTYCLPTAGFTKIFGNNAFSYRLLSAICGFLFIFVIYFFAKTFFKDKNIALLSAFFVALSYWQIAWSREARWYTELEVFFWLSLSFFYLFIESQSKKIKTIGIILSSVFAVLAISTHKLAYLLPIIFLIFLIIKNTKQYFKNKKSIIYQLLFVVALLIFVEYVLGFRFITNTIGNLQFHYNLPYYLSFYLRNYWPFIVIAIYGLISAQGEEKKKHLMLWSTFLIYLIPLSFLTNIVHYRYLFHLTPIFYLATAYTISTIPSKDSQRFLKPAIIAVLIILFFITGQGLLYPKSFYALESDDPTKLNRPYYAYTPQPDWNKAYAAIKENIKPDEIIISSHPHFNKIFLNQPGYWIKYDYLGIEKTAEQIDENKEYYVGAEVINNIEELKKITAAKHGYIIFDYMSIDGRISSEIIKHIQSTTTQFFYNKISLYSQIWVYRF